MKDNKHSHAEDHPIAEAPVMPASKPEPEAAPMKTPVDSEAIKADITNLTNQIRSSVPAKDARASAVALVEGIADRFLAVQADAAQVRALATQLKDAAGGLGAAVVAGT